VLITRPGFGETAGEILQRRVVSFNLFAMVVGIYLAADAEPSDRFTGRCRSSPAVTLKDVIHVAASRRPSAGWPGSKPSINPRSGAAKGLQRNLVRAEFSERLKRSSLDVTRPLLMSGHKR